MSMHHVGIAVRDLAESLRFYCEGLGYQVFFEQTFDKDWRRLVDTPAARMRAVLVGDPQNPVCPIELIAFEDDVRRAKRSGPPTGIFLMAFTVEDVGAVKARLAKLGFGEFEQDFSEIGGHRLDVTFVRDPDGNVVELVAARQVQAAGI